MKLRFSKHGKNRKKDFGSLLKFLDIDHHAKLMKSAAKNLQELFT